MDTFVLDERDLAFEYELQKNCDDKTVWIRYIDSKKVSDVKTAENIIWLYMRYCSQFKHDFECFEQFLDYLIDAEVVGLDFYIQTVFDTELVCKMINGVSKNNSAVFEKICLKLLDYEIKKYNLANVSRVLDQSLKFCKNQQSLIKLWRRVLEFIQIILDQTEQLRELGGGNDSNEFDEIMSLLTSNKSEYQDETIKNQWCSKLLQRYLLVCSKCNVEFFLGLLYKTNDYKVIISCYKKYLYDSRKLKEIPLSLQLNYLNSLKQLSLNEEFETLILQLIELEEINDNNLNFVYYKFLIETGKFTHLENLLDIALKETKQLETFINVFNFHLNFELAYIEFQNSNKNDTEASIHMNKLKYLINGYEYLYNDLKVRQNPNYIPNWSSRLDIIDKNTTTSNAQDKLISKLDVFKQAILKIDPWKVLNPGTLGKFWCKYAEIYWNNKQLDEAREVMHTSLKVPFQYLEDLEEIWLFWAEKELKQNNDVMTCMNILETALKVPENTELVYEIYKTKINNNEHVPAQMIVFTSKKLWTFYIDVLESKCISSPDETTIEKTIETYEKMINTKVATPMTFLNYATFLQSLQELEKCIRLFERALMTFPKNVQFYIWIQYLKLALNNIDKLSVEHLRDLFDQSISSLPEEADCDIIYIMYSDFEENVTKFYQKSVDILLQALDYISTMKQSNSTGKKVALSNLMIDKSKKYLTIEHLRKIYEECLQVLPNSVAVSYALKFAMMETEAKNYERVRSILQYAVQLLPPSKNQAIWDYWNDFEIKYGDKENYKEMLRLKLKLTTEMRVDTVETSQTEGRIEFVSANSVKKTKETNVGPSNPDEISLDL